MNVNIHAFNRIEDQNTKVYEREEKNRKIIDELMEAHLKEVAKRERLEQEIEKMEGNKNGRRKILKG